MTKQKPDFKRNISKLFVTVPEDLQEERPAEIQEEQTVRPAEILAEKIQEQPAAQEAEAEAPRGAMRVLPPTKSKHLHLLIRPDTDKALAKEAKKRRISKNELINQILEEHTKGAK